MTPRMAIRGVIGIGLSIVAVALLLDTVDLSSVASRLSALEPGWLLVAPLSLAVQLAIRSRRWAFLLTTASGSPVRLVRVVGPLTVGYLANAILPARLGEVARSVLVSRRERLPFGLVISSVVVERLLDLAALLALGVTTTGVAVIGWPAIAIAVALLAGLGVVILGAPAISRGVARLAPAPIRASIASFLAGLGAVGLRAAIIVVALSALAWLGDVALMWAAARSLGVELAVPAAVAIAVGAALGTALPAASGYVGTYEIGAVAIGALAGTAPDTVLAIAVVAHVLAVVPVALLGALTVARTGLPLSRARDETADGASAAA